jgi:hypothetical protein
MKDVTSVKIVYLKALLLFLAGVLTSIIIFLECRTVKVTALLGLAIWCFARSYYFAFYVIEHYVDSDYKFSGLWSFVRYVCHRQKGRN